MKNAVRNKLVLFITALFLIPGFLSVAPVLAEPGGYIVEPATPDMITGPPQDLVRVEVWQLPPRVLAIHLALVICPLLLYPIELLFLLKMFAYLGCRTVSRATVFHNEARSRIHSCIQDNPGIFFNDLMRLTSMNRGTLRYHLILMNLMRSITTLESFGNPRYFNNSGMYSDSEKTVLLHIRNQMDCRILRLLLEKSDLSRDELGEYLGLTVSTVSWRMKRLSDEKLIWIRKTGKNVQYEINPEVRPYLEKYLIPNKDITASMPFEPVPEPA